MNYLSKILNFFYTSPKDRHLWNIRVGEKYHYVHEILNNYDLLGENILKIQDFFQSYRLVESTPSKLVYEIKSNKKGRYMLVLYFCDHKISKVIYTFLSNEKKNFV
ncbi:hypothetical protein CHRY9390_02433 [Chryseobacterium aquaeductus]|uniref:Uncharacterized protein n=1 Tax=Chryseobacterium aquaeductus TaxID=2675056 RepID=A0A9N8MH64_9FLAO|nr:hypothetical protein CHRY9390_02433 [Chryseobacterium potabilaquae]CAD7811894.1 hypothetical protein CHRY9390_02433 [Chryseobacterium aquaeductus]